MTATWIIPEKLWEKDGAFYAVTAPNPDGTYAGVRLAPAQPRVLPPLLALVAVSLWLGIMIGIFFGYVSRFGADAPQAVPFSRSELDLPVVSTTTTPTKIELVIDTRENINAVSPTAHAYSYPTEQPCRIVIPEGMPIVAHPARSRAEWGDPSDGNTLAHEILHCLKGTWHPK